MRKFWSFTSSLLVALSMFALTGCQRIETGEVGVRIGFDKQLQSGELQPGSFNQTFVGSILTFQVKDVNVDVNDLTPLSADNSTMKDFDITVSYFLNPSQASELYGTKSKAFHAVNADGDVLLMYNWVAQTTRNAVFKAARKYEALGMSDHRAEIEAEVQEHIKVALNNEGMPGVLTVSRVQVRAVTPADSVVVSSNGLVAAKNELKQKEVEVQTAKKEAERIAALNANAGAIEYMNAQANMLIAQGVANGKVQTIVVPVDFRGIVTTGK